MVNEISGGKSQQNGLNFHYGNFVMEMNVDIMAWNYLNNGMLLNLINNLYVPFDIPFDPKRFYKDGVTRKLRRPRDQRNQYLRFEGLQYTNIDIADFKERLDRIYGREVIMIDLFYLRGVDVGSVNIPYLLARYLRLFASGRKREAMIFEICEELDDTWAWVASGPERQPDAAAGAPEITKGTLHVDEGG
nr:hypothetical protein [Tanacetum cinerariifolium]